MGEKIRPTVDDLKGVEFFTVNQLADLLHVNQATVRGWVARQTGPDYIKIGGRCLFSKEHVNEWLANA